MFYTVLTLILEATNSYGWYLFYTDGALFPEVVLPVTIVIIVIVNIFLLYMLFSGEADLSISLSRVLIYIVAFIVFWGLMMVVLFLVVSFFVLVANS